MSNMKITVSQLRSIIREEVEKATGVRLKDGGVVNRDSGEILDMDSVPPQYLDHVEVDEMGYTTLPHDKFEELRGELKGSSAFNVGDMVEEKGTDSGLWKIMELFSDNKTGKTIATLKMFQPTGGRTPTTYVTTDKLRKVKMKNESHPGSFAFGDSPDPQDVHDEFLMWRDKNGEVPLEKLASELGVKPQQINWNGTGLRVLNGVVSELLGDTPYRVV